MESRFVINASERSYISVIVSSDQYASAQKLNSLLVLQNRTDVQASKTAKKTSADEGLFTGLSRAIQHVISFRHTLHRMEDT